MASSTVVWSAAALVISSVLAHRGVTAAEEDGPATAKPVGERVHLPIRGAEFYARSLRLDGTKVIATGDVSARLERFPRVEIRATQLEYRIGGNKVKLEKPVWTYPVEERESERLKIHAESATFRIDEETVVAKTIRLQFDDGKFLLSLTARSGRWTSESRACRLESIAGDVFTARDKEGRGSPDEENFRVKITRATVQLSPDLKPAEIRLDRISGVERTNGYKFEAATGVLASSHGDHLGAARWTRVKIVAPRGHTFESDMVTYRPPER